MLSSAAPALLPKPWAAGAAGAYIRPIPTASQIGVQGGAASLTDGFPPLTMTPQGSGGVNPFGQDSNGILNWLSAINQWYQAGGPVTWNSAFCTAISGYPKGAVLQAAGLGGGFWLNTVEGNVTNPDSGGSAGWANFFAPVFAGPTFTGTTTFNGPVVVGNGQTVNLNALATAATQGPGDNSTKLATTAYVDRQAGSTLSAAETYADGTYIPGAAGGETSPAGRLMQWQTFNIPTGNGDVVNLEFPFPHSFDFIITSDSGGNVYRTAGAPLTNSQATLWARDSAGAYTPAGVRVLAIGH